VQDLINRLFQGVPIGTYVDVGCNHPIRESLTYPLYERGWRGLCVDPNPDFADEWRGAREGDAFVVAAISDDLTSRDFYLGSDSSLSTFDADYANSHSKRGVRFKVTHVHPKTLASVVSEHLPSESEIHLLCVDTEGHEINVLRSLFNRSNLKAPSFLPGAIIVEIKNLSLMRPIVNQTEIADMLLDIGYVMVAKDLLNACFIMPEKPYFKWIPIALTRT